MRRYRRQLKFKRKLRKVRFITNLSERILSATSSLSIMQGETLSLHSVILPAVPYTTSPAPPPLRHLQPERPGVFHEGTFSKVCKVMPNCKKKGRSWTISTPHSDARFLVPVETSQGVEPPRSPRSHVFPQCSL